MIASYLSLTKPRITLMVVVTAAIGYFLASRSLVGSSLPGAGSDVFWHLFFTLFGTALTSSGAGVLNHYLERDCDALMKRTCKRPLPLGDISPANALGFGATLVIIGTIVLVAEANLLTGFLALLTAFLYVVVYTPLKRVSWLNTFIGAIPGAIPPMGGWAAASGELSLGAWVLFAIMFIWQHPHFYAIAWMFREDYARGGFQMLPVVEPDGKSTFRQILIYSLLLLPVSSIPYFIGMSGAIYLWGVVVMGLGIIALSVKLIDTRSMLDARRMLRATVLYLPVLLVLIMSDMSLQ